MKYYISTNFCILDVMKTILPRLISISLIFFFEISFAQPNEIHFNNFSVDEGLSQSGVRRVFKDHQGFMWFGTQDGLNRYDGFEFKTFFYEPNDSTSLGNNFIWEIFEDSQHNLWIGNFGGGLCLFNRELETFKTFYPNLPATSNLNERSVKYIKEFPKGTLWLSTHAGVALFDLSKMEFVENPTPLKSFGKKELSKMNNLFIINENRVILVVKNHLFLVDINSGEAHQMFSEKLEISEFGKIAKHQKNQFWINSSSGLLLTKYVESADSLKILRTYQIEKESGKISDHLIHDIYKDRNGLVWFATMKGLFVLDSKNEAADFINYTHDENSPNGLPSNFVFDIYEDDSQTIWLGTGNGVSRFSIFPPPFQNFSFAKNRTELCGSFVAGIQEDTFGNLWVGGREGLTVIKNFDQATDQWEFNCHNPTNQKDLKHKYVLGISKDRSGDLWLCYHRDGFAKVIQNEKGDWRLESYSDLIAPDYFKNHAINAIYEDRSGVFWIASSGKNLIKFDPKKKTHKTFVYDDHDFTKLSHPYVYVIFEDSKNNFWLGTAAGGLCKMDREKETFTRYAHDPNQPNNLSHNMVTYIFEDSKTRLWICTANGLNLMETEGKFKRFSKKDGLPNDFTYGMVEDKNGDLWVSTNNGISKITFEQGVFTTENFNSNHGLFAGNEFNQNGYFKTKDNRLCFGGTNGLSVFDPNEIKPYPFVPQVALTDFLLFNESVSVAPKKIKKGKFNLNQSINETKEVNLKHYQNFLAFEFAALGFAQSENNKYAYQMEGVDQDWVQSGTRRLASYPNLKSGNYVFKIKAANHEGIWNEELKSIAINIAPPPWKTWWAYLIYLATAVLAIYGIIWFRVQNVRRVEKAKLAERELFRKRSARDFHDEAGNQITKISLMTEIAKRKSNGNFELNNLVDQIGDEIQTLRSGMRDFIWVLDPDNDNLYETLMRLKEFANGIFEFSQIHFTTKGIDEYLKTIALSGNQRRHLLLIFKEGINNSLKYSAAQNAQFSVLQNEEIIELKFSDDGIGFEKENQKNGQGLKNIKSRAEKMGVKHDIFSEKNKGSAISIFINITHMGN